MPENKETARSIAILAAALDRQNSMTKERTAVYVEYLKDIPPDALERGVRRLVTSFKINVMPTIAEIRSASIGIDEDRLEVRAMEAFGRAETMLITGDRDDPTIDETLRLAFGGWAGFGESDPNNSYDKKRFMDAYKIAARGESRMDQIEASRAELLRLRMMRLGLPEGEKET